MNSMSAQTVVRSNALASRPFYTRVAALGYLLIALGGIVAAGIALITSSMGELGFSLAILAIAFGFAEVLPDREIATANSFSDGAREVDAYKKTSEAGMARPRHPDMRTKLAAALCAR